MQYFKQLIFLVISLVLVPSVGGSRSAKMSFDSKQFRELIVRPALEELNMWSRNAEELLMLTAAQESHLGTYLRQVGQEGGYSVARGVFQMEPETFNWLRSIPAYNGLLYGIADDMVHDLKLAAKAARLRYRVVPRGLPKHDDVVGLASYWKIWYNASPRGGSVEEAIGNYRKFVHSV